MAKIKMADNNVVVKDVGSPELNCTMRGLKLIYPNRKFLSRIL